jgi:UPF0716 protein FxsA
VIVLVANAIGVWNTIGLLIISAVVGVWLMRHEGFQVLQRLREQRAAGNVPTDELIDGFLVFVGGVLLILPGFISDFFGLLILFPPTRTLVRNVLKRRFTVVTFRRYNGPFDDPPGGSGPPVIDV